MEGGEWQPPGDALMICIETGGEEEERAEIMNSYNALPGAIGLPGSEGQIVLGLEVQSQMGFANSIEPVQSAES